MLFVIYSFFALILHNYKDDIMVAPVDVKSFGKRKANKKNAIPTPAAQAWLNNESYK